MRAMWGGLGVVMLVAGCGSSSSGGGSAAGAGASSGTGASTELAGAWDFMGTQGTRMVAGTISVDAGSLSIAANGGTLTLARQGDALSVTYTDADVTESATGQQTGSGTASFGAFPFDLSGTLTFTEVVTDPLQKTGTCGGTFTPSAITATCQDVGRPPHPAPRRLDGTLNATRTSAAASIFGDLGGVWSGSGAGGETCMITVQGSSVSTSCTGGALAGGLTMVFSGNVASGTTTSGVEFSAQRR